MRKFQAVIIIACCFVFIAGCSKPKHDALQVKRDSEVIESIIEEFWKSFQITQDEIYKAAIVKEDEEPDKARDYFNAHTTLRNLFYDANTKTMVMAQILTYEPTAFRPLIIEPTGEKFDITIALGPTESKTGVLTMRKKDDEWRVYDFDNVWAKWVKSHPENNQGELLLGD